MKNLAHDSPSTLDVLQLMFITLKIMGYIDLDWWWVFSPTWLYVLGLLFIRVFKKD